MYTPTATVIILGAGPAGMSCANVLLSFGLKPVVIENTDQAGGIQRTNFHPNLWMLGLPGETGQEITARLTRHYFALGISTLLRTEVKSVTRTNAGFQVVVATPTDQQEFAAAAIVVATGMHPRATAVLETLRRESGRVIIGPLSEVIRDDISGCRVLILGGGDNALDHGLFLAAKENHVCVCARRRFSARQHFIAECQASPAIELRQDCSPDALSASDDRVMAKWSDGEETYDWLLVMYGYQPNTEVLARFADDIRPNLGKSGHILVDQRQQSSIAGIYAAGDVTDNIQPSVATAIAQGLAAARAVERDLCLSDELRPCSPMGWTPPSDGIEVPDWRSHNQSSRGRSPR